MLSQKIISDLITNRQELHKIPEPGFKEFKTQNYIFSTLTNLGFAPFKICETGVALFIDFNCKESIAFRADIDALPIEEENDVPFKSTHCNFMHACGHDAHTSILLGFAQYLQEKYKINNKGLKCDATNIFNEHNPKYNILLIFQPAEENPGGAKSVVETGIFKKYNVKYIFGLHLSPKLDQGIIGTKSGGFMAKSAEINVDIKGKSGHCGQPQTSIDSIQAAIKFLHNMNEIKSKRLSPFDPSIISFNKIVGGTVRNIVAEHTRLEGSIRSFSDESFQFIVDSIKNIAKSLEIDSGVKISVDIDSGYPPVINDLNCYNTLVAALTHCDTIKFQEIEAEMLAEDFSFYQKEIPGLFFFLGCKNPEQEFIHPLHSSKFNFHEKVLELGVISFILLLNEINK